MPNLRFALTAAATTAFVTLAFCAPKAIETAASTAPPAISPGDWLTFNRTLAGDRFSPLKDLNRSNVARLQQRCSYTLPEVTSL